MKKKFEILKKIWNFEKINLKFWKKNLKFWKKISFNNRVFFWKVLRTDDNVMQCRQNIAVVCGKPGLWIPGTQKNTPGDEPEISKQKNLSIKLLVVKLWRTGWSVSRSMLIPLPYVKTDERSCPSPPHDAETTASRKPLKSLQFVNYCSAINDKNKKFQKIPFWFRLFRQISYTVHFSNVKSIFLKNFIFHADNSRQRNLIYTSLYFHISIFLYEFFKI